MKVPKIIKRPLEVITIAAVLVTILAAEAMSMVKEWSEGGVE